MSPGHALVLLVLIVEPLGALHALCQKFPMPVFIQVAILLISAEFILDIHELFPLLNGIAQPFKVDQVLNAMRTRHSVVILKGVNAN